MRTRTNGSGPGRRGPRSSHPCRPPPRGEHRMATSHTTPVHTLVVGVFEDAKKARTAVDDLRRAGFLDDSLDCTCGGARPHVEASNEKSPDAGGDWLEGEIADGHTVVTVRDADERAEDVRETPAPARRHHPRAVPGGHLRDRPAGHPLLNPSARRRWVSLACRTGSLVPHVTPPAGSDHHPRRRRRAGEIASAGRRRQEAIRLPSRTARAPRSRGPIRRTPRCTSGPTASSSSARATCSSTGRATPGSGRGRGPCPTRCRSWPRPPA